MAFLEDRLTLGKCQPTSVAFPASKNRETKSITDTIKPHNLGRSREILDFKQEEKYPILWKGNSSSVDKCSTVNAVLHRTAKPDAN